MGTHRLCGGGAFSVCLPAVHTHLQEQIRGGGGEWGVDWGRSGGLFSPSDFQEIAKKAGMVRGRSRRGAGGGWRIAEEGGGLVMGGQGCVRPGGT